MTAVDVNYRYFVHYVMSLPRYGGFRVLDFGCGSGMLVSLLRERGIDCYGADVFYGGADFGSPGEQALRRQGIVRAIPPDRRLPFADGFFDLVISNQVFEHVEDLDGVIGELHRVLKHDGLSYHHFPSREVIREGHIGIPLAHRLPRRRFRFLYTRLLRSAGLGTFKGEVSSSQWARERLEWLDRYCCYRGYDELMRAFEPLFVVTHREIDYCNFRASGSRLLEHLLAFDQLTQVYERVFRRLAFMALELRRRPTASAGEL